MTAIITAAGCSGTQPADGDPTTSSGFGESEDSTANRLDLGFELPEGCGDGVVVPGQYCYEPIPIEGMERIGDVFGIDFDGDGRDELVVTDDHAGLLVQFGFEEDRLVELARFEDNGVLVWTTDFDRNRDGKRDLLLLRGTAPAFSWYLNEGRVLREREDDAFPDFLGMDSGYTISNGGTPAAVDLDGDAFPEFVAAIYYSGLAVPLKTAQIVRKGARGWVLDAPASEGYPVPGCGWFADNALADLDEDGRPEVVVLDADDFCDPVRDQYDPEYHRFLVFGTNPKTGDFDLLRSVPVGENQWIVSSAGSLWVRDVDADGHVDVVVRTNSDGTTPGLAIHYGRGDGTFRAPTVFVGSTDAIAQLDDDPALEIVLDDADGIHVVDGLTTDAARVLIYPPTVQYVGAAEAGDVNGDGLDDLALVDQLPGAPDRVLLLVSRP